MGSLSRSLSSPLCVCGGTLREGIMAAAAAGRGGVVAWVYVAVLATCHVGVRAGESEGGHCPRVVFVFGDSLSDTGNLQAARNPALPEASRLPYGSTYFRRASNRFSDGRLIIDCILQSLGLPFLNPFMDFVGTNFSLGANYAVGSATALDYDTDIALEAPPYTRRTLDVQLEWHKTFLQYALAGVQGVTTFPTATAITKATHFIETGGNDITNFLLTGKTQEQVTNLIPLLLDKVSNSVQVLYDLGARHFMISGIGLLGCSPMILFFAGNGQTLDDRGCMIWANGVSQNYTQSLGVLASTLGQLLPDTTFSFLDLYSAFDEIMTFPENYGINNIVDVCCGSPNLGAATIGGYNPITLCNPNSVLCDDPNTYLHWDGIHFTDNTYRQLTNMFIDGRFITPTNALSQCTATHVPRA